MLDERIYYLETIPILYLFIADHLPFNDDTLKKIKKKANKKIIVLTRKDFSIMKRLLEGEIINSGIYNLI